MINGRTNILEYPCQEVNKSVPYFLELPTQDKKGNSLTVNEYLYKTVEKMNKE